jgi:hypothetical protein
MRKFAHFGHSENEIDFPAPMGGGVRYWNQKGLINLVGAFEWETNYALSH